MFKSSGAQLTIVGLVASMLAIAPDAAWSQAAPPPTLGLQSPAQQSAPAQPTQPAEPPPASRDENPGLINEIEKLFEKSKSLLPPLKSPSETIDDLNARTRDASQSLSNMAKPSTMVKGRTACLIAANGAPDCKAGADRLCQSKGYKEGNSLDTDAAEKCSPKVYMPGYKPAGRLQDRKFRDAGDVSVTHASLWRIMPKRIAASVKTQYLTLERLA